MMKALVSWSSGKDSAWALHIARRELKVEVVGLLTTVNRRYERVAMHAVRRELLEAQAAAVGLPLWPVEIRDACTHDEYDGLMRAAIDGARSEGVEAIVFGDLFLQDVRRYREEQLAAAAVQPLFPLWARPTRALATEMLAAGLVAKVTCVDPRLISASLAGRSWDSAFIDALPPTADPCGENGEFHTFVCAGPMFTRQIPIKSGEVVTRDGFVFADLLLMTNESRSSGLGAAGTV
jgi:uncharacterized protein (TIGR00290 family)